MKLVKGGLLLIIVLLIPLTPGCFGRQSSPGPNPSQEKWEHIQAHEAKSLLDSNGDVVLLDVRETFEYTARRIPGSLHIPLGELLTGRDRELSEGKTYIIVCRSGNRSQTAAQYLVEQGRNWTIYNLRQGVIGWPYQLEGEDVN